MSFFTDWSEFRGMVHTWSLAAPGLAGIAQATLSWSEARRYARRHYAEVRTFIDLKIPCRLRLCPADALDAKKYFWMLYAEEQGQFRAPDNHAEMFRRFCNDIGITDDELEEEWAGYWPHYRYLLTELPSRDVLVRELSVSYTWESMTARLAPAIEKLAARLFPDGGVDFRYFTEHSVVDEDHAGEALFVLEKYADTPELRTIAVEAAKSTLTEQNPFVLSPSVLSTRDE